jgi:transcriptional regulator with XRE-family HTH domain
MVGDRIKKIIELLNTDARHFAEKLGVEPSSISHLISGRNKPSFNFLEKLVKTYPEVNVVWLLSGEGEPLTNTNKNYVKQNIFDFDNQGNKNIETKEDNINIEINKTNSAIQNKKVEKIILIYSDGTFKIYNNEDL